MVDVLYEFEEYRISSKKIVVLSFWNCMCDHCAEEKRGVAMAIVSSVEV